MSWLLFMDESGHDHTNTPCEVRGGVAFHASKIWPFIKDWQDMVLDVFGDNFEQQGGEIKGSKLLSNKRMKWASQMDELSHESRHNGINRFLTQSLQKQRHTKRDFTAYGQGCRMMARGIFDLLGKHEAVLFASLIPRGVRKSRDFGFEHYLRKDHIFLQERFFNFLEDRHEHGLFVMDQTEKQNDKKFVQRLQNYYLKTHNGIVRTTWIVPVPLFVDSEMSPAVQAADLCLYCVNWGFRRDEWNFKGLRREGIFSELANRCGRLQYQGQVYDSDEGKVFPSFGIIFVPDPYTARNPDE